MIFLLVLGIMVMPFALEEWDRRQHRREITNRQALESQYYRDWYPRRVGRVKLTNGDWVFMRIQSIDKGNSWLVVTEGEEVIGYLSKLYPHLDPKEDFEPIR